MSAEFAFGDHSPLVAHPKNVAIGYDVGKISAACLVSFCQVNFATKSTQNDQMRIVRLIVY